MLAGNSAFILTTALVFENTPADLVHGLKELQCLKIGPCMSTQLSQGEVRKVWRFCVLLAILCIASEIKSTQVQLQTSF
jgi:hypothetical protein